MAPSAAGITHVAFPWPSLPGWKRDGGTQGVLAPRLLCRLFPTPRPTLSSHEATPEPPPVLTLKELSLQHEESCRKCFQPVGVEKGD